MKKYKNYNFDQFVTDSDFIQWVLNSTVESDHFWKNVIQQFPEKEGAINEAVAFIQSLKAVEKPIPQERLDLVWNKAKQAKVRKISLQAVWWWAAVFIMLVGISLLIPKIQKAPKFNFAENKTEQYNEARIILPDGSVSSIPQKESEIKIASAGEIIVNKDTLNSANLQQSQEKFIKVVMPYGQQTSLQLPDGTTVYVNAGSQLSFPVSFDGKKREVYLTGEAFFDVVKDKEHPFIVYTPDVDIMVTGTEFNVSAYSDDNFTQTVLVEGAVSVSKKVRFSKSIDISPGESALFDKESESISTSKIDTEQYTSWIHGYIICENDPVNEVIKKIGRYYNSDIILDGDLSNITFSGKLDLKEDVQNVLNSIAYTSSLTVETEHDIIRIKN
ncbi:FecR domain-containing protein [Maribellus sp. CM-23]|uniref:FecR family protein n=1 Tax=Maribellus sp. CM-23 TaxID=2781026 RepID=UPI001F47D2A7|nr:FecR domain-containing protein [Maribellus sp. CM-23]MCE4566610.1 FecR domain-containing protein [Maribellus sp. CM-23]